jgi:hypothetical protein
VTLHAREAKLQRIEFSRELLPTVKLDLTVYKKVITSQKMPGYCRKNGDRIEQKGNASQFHVHYFYEILTGILSFTAHEI